MDKWLDEIELKGDLVTLQPLRVEHQAELADAVKDGKLWELWYTSVPSPDTVSAYINTALKQQADGESLPFVVRSNSSKKIVGCTRYLNIAAPHRRLEIGHTWYSKSSQRSGVNTECKLLLLTHAFEVLNAVCVQFLTHWHNHASRNAILRLGAKQDGVLRNDRIDSAGAHRDTVVFSIVEHEWLAVKRSLETKKSGR